MLEGSGGAQIAEADPPVHVVTAHQITAADAHTDLVTVTASCVVTAAPLEPDAEAAQEVQDLILRLGGAGRRASFDGLVDELGGQTSQEVQDLILRLRNEVEEDVILHRSCFLSPHRGRFRLSWDFALLAATMLVLAVMPMRVAPSLLEVDVLDRDALFSFDVCVCLVLVLDMMITFRTAFVDRSGRLIADQRHIKLRYLRGWIVVDLLACISTICSCLLLRQDNKRHNIMLLSLIPLKNCDPNRGITKGVLCSGEENSSSGSGSEQEATVDKNLILLLAALPGVLKLGRESGRIFRRVCSTGSSTCCASSVCSLIDHIAAVVTVVTTWVVVAVSTALATG